MFAVLLPSVAGKGHWPVQVAETRDVCKARQVNWNAHQCNVFCRGWRTWLQKMQLAAFTWADKSPPWVGVILFWAVWLTQIIGGIHFRKSFFVGKEMKYGNTKYISGLFVCFSQISAEIRLSWFAEDGVSGGLSKWASFSCFKKKWKIRKGEIK